MDECKQRLTSLTHKDAAAACALAAQIVAESRQSDRWYPYWAEFAALLRHKNSLVRNRAIALLAANVRWDKENRYDALLDELLCHITDEKPITARQCIQALPELAAAKPQWIPRLRATLEQADFAGYRDSMQPLLLKDRIAVLKRLSEME